MSRNSREVFLPSGWLLALTRIGKFSDVHSPNLFGLSGDVIGIHQLEFCRSGKLAGLFAFYAIKSLLKKRISSNLSHMQEKVLRRINEYYCSFLCILQRLRYKRIQTCQLRQISYI